MLVATLAIAGIPPLAGFFSKDEILASAFGAGHPIIWIAGLIGAVLTAFYMFRLYLLAFRGPSHLSHETEHHLHESPPSMIIPLVVLAILTVVGGFVGLPMQQGGHVLARWLAPVFAGGTAHEAELPASTEWLLIAISVAAGLIGIGLAVQLYSRRPDVAGALRERWAGAHRALSEKYWIDELYDRIVVRPVYGFAMWAWRFWDQVIVDGIVNGVGYTLEGASALLRLFQTGFVGTYALFFTLGVAALLLHLLRHHP
jgi:NADH-quinone oxidoreductase subunit L